jgi:hypothetical protein
MQTIPSATLLTGAEALGHVARLHEAAARKQWRQPALRAELASLRRWSRRDLNWRRDGFDADMLGISPIAAPLVRFAAPLMFERKRTLSAAGILFVSGPAGGSVIDRGRTVHRTLLEAARLGFAAAPLEALIGDAQTTRAVQTAYPLPAGHSLIGVFRAGPIGADKPDAPARFPPGALIIGDPACR